MDKMIEIGNVKLAPAHKGYFLTITDKLYGVPVEHTWAVTEEELIELYEVIMVLIEEGML